MSSIIRRMARAYLDRRTPWGPPWWVYAIALGAANLVRQAVLWRTDASSAAGLAAFVVMVPVVFGAVTGAAVLLGRRDLGRRAGRPGAGPEQLTLWTEGPHEPEAEGVAAGEEAGAGEECGDQSYVASADQRLPSTVSR